MVTTTITQAKQRINDIEAQRADLKKRLDYMRGELERRRAALLAGEMSPGEAALSDWITVIRDLEAQAAEHTVSGAPIQLGAALRDAQRDLEALQAKKTQLEAFCEKLRQAAATGLEAKARAALEAVPAVAAYVHAIGMLSDLPRLLTGLEGHARKDLNALASLPDLEKEIAALGA